VSLVNSTLSGNRITGTGSGTGHGSAIAQGSGSLTMQYTTISRNSGEIAYYKSSGSATIANSIIADNPDGDCHPGSSFDVLGTSNLDSDGSCPGFTITAPPLLDPLADNGGNTMTHGLQFASPARNAAGGDCPPEDQRDSARPRGSACDLGAYEVYEPTRDEVVIPRIEPTEPAEIVSPVPEEPEPPAGPGWSWKFEGYVCSESNLTEMYISTDADPGLFSITIDERPVKCYQQSYDNTRYWCHVERVMLDWDAPTMISFCVEDVCQEVQRTTLSRERCEGDDPVTEPEPQACSTFDNPNSCTVAPGCEWACYDHDGTDICGCLDEE